VSQGKIAVYLAALISFPFCFRSTCKNHHILKYHLTPPTQEHYIARALRNKDCAMTAKRKRAPGGGRKRLGPSVARNLTIRIDDELRERLEIEAGNRAKRKRNWNLSQEILMRLNQSLDKEQEADTATRAICFLISQLIRVGIRPNNNLWHRDPFLFRSFKLAVGNFLSKIEPPGEIIAPARLLTRVLKTPELLAEYLSEMLFDNLLMPPLTPTKTAENAEELRKEGGEELASEYLREEYDMERARRHLGIEIKGKNGK
jgi:hypothetical protein